MQLCEANKAAQQRYGGSMAAAHGAPRRRRRQHVRATRRAAETLRTSSTATARHDDARGLLGEHGQPPTAASGALATRSAAEIEIARRPSTPTRQPGGACQRAAPSTAHVVDSEQRAAAPGCTTSTLSPAGKASDSPASERADPESRLTPSDVTQCDLRLPCRSTSSARQLPTRRECPVSVPTDSPTETATRGLRREPRR